MFQTVSILEMAIPRFTKPISDMFVFACWVYTLTRGRHEQTTVTKVHIFFKKCRNLGILWLYLESPSKMHSNKSKHVWYWLSNSREIAFEICEL